MPHCKFTVFNAIKTIVTYLGGNIIHLFSRVSRRIHIFTYMLRQRTCIAFILQF
jgi:predicted transcriptional regulator